MSHDEVLKIKYNDGVNGLLEKRLDTKYLKEMNMTLTPNGQHFSTKRQGFLPKLMKSMYDERVIYKKKMLEEEQRKQFKWLEDKEMGKKVIEIPNFGKTSINKLRKTFLDVLP